MDSPQAFLFDLDGVLLNTEHLNRKTWIATSNHFGYRLNNQQLNNLLGRRKIECAKYIIKLVNKVIEVEELLAIQKKFHRKILNKVEAIPDAEKLVTFCCNSNIKTALVTSSTKDSYNFKSKDNRWINQIDVKVFGDNPDLRNGKPDPEPYLLAASKLKVNTQSCWVLEDSETGIKSASDAGCLVWELKSNINGCSNSSNQQITKIKPLLLELKKIVSENQ